MDLPLFVFTVTIVLAVSSLPCGNSQGQATSTAEAKADLLRSCYNKHYNGTASVFEDFLGGFNTSLYLQEIYISAKRSELPMTIFVGATLERLTALEAQCRSYPGPLSAALYVPLRQTQSGPSLTPQNADALQQAVARVRAVFDRLESSPSACVLTTLLLYEVVGDPPLVGLVPINSLRNAALMAAATPLVAMVDVDLAPSTTLAAEVLAPGGSSLSELTRSCSERGVWVLPAWETHKALSMQEGTRVADLALRGDKSALQRFEQDSSLHSFAKHAYSRGHAATNFSRWLESDVPYIVQYEINYEPWFIMSRELVPPYDVRFRGYGWNKVQQVAAMALSNFTLWVHPGAWLVHRPHEKSRGQQLYGGGGGGDGAGQPGGRRQRPRDEVREWRGSSVPIGRLFHRRVSALRHVCIRDMRRGVYVAAVDPQTRHCRAVLPWWRGVRNAAWEPGQRQGQA